MVWPPTSAVPPLAILISACVGRAGRHADGDEHDAEVDDHPAVGPTDDAAPTLSPARQHDLTGGRAAAEPGEEERHERQHPAGAERDGDDQHADADPRRPQQPLAQQLTRRLAPRQHRRDRHEEQQRQPDGSGHPVEVRRTDREAVVVHRLDDEREHGAQQDDERERREEHVVGQEGALARER
jgi:hypothetical protein